MRPFHLHLNFFLVEIWVRKINYEDRFINPYANNGMIMSPSGSFKIKEKRREARTNFEMPEFIAVEFKLGKGSRKEKTYDLNVLNRSVHGLALLITEKDFELVQALNCGDKLQNIMFFAPSAMIRVDGTVRHMTKLEEGQLKGCYILGLESDEITESAKPK